MQTQMEGKIDFLESQVKKLQAELGRNIYRPKHIIDNHIHSNNSVTV